VSNDNARFCLLVTPFNSSTLDDEQENKIINLPPTSAQIIQTQKTTNHAFQGQKIAKNVFNDAGEPAPEDFDKLKNCHCSECSSTGNRTLVSRGLSLLMTSGNHSH
jgi:hypothetical protein